MLAQLRHMLIFIFLNEHTNYFHQGSKGVIFIFAYFVNQPVKLFHQSAVFPVVVRYTQRRLHLWPDGKRFVQLCG